MAAVAFYRSCNWVKTKDDWLNFQDFLRLFKEKNKLLVLDFPNEAGIRYIQIKLVPKDKRTLQSRLDIAYSYKDKYSDSKTKM